MSVSEGVAGDGVVDFDGEVMVMVAPMGMSPVQTVPAVPMDRVPELAVAFAVAGHVVGQGRGPVLTLIP